MSTIEELKREAMRKENWEGESKRYRLHAIPSGPNVFALKESVAEGEPPHYLCANCFTRGQKSYLASARNIHSFTALVCSVCSANMDTRFRGELNMDYVQ